MNNWKGVIYSALGKKQSSGGDGTLSNKQQWHDGETLYILEGFMIIQCFENQCACYRVSRDFGT